MVTVTKTPVFNRLINTPDCERVDGGGGYKDKYKSGKASVKGLHYLKFIGLELISEKNFTLVFHKFFSNEIKNLIRSVSNVKFSPELRAWIFTVVQYEPLMQELNKICLVNKIHIEDIP